MCIYTYIYVYVNFLSVSSFWWFLLSSSGYIVSFSMSFFSKVYIVSTFNEVLLRKDYSICWKKYCFVYGCVMGLLFLLGCMATILRVCPTGLLLKPMLLDLWLSFLWLWLVQNRIVNFVYFMLRYSGYCWLLFFVLGYIVSF